jgi:hypothetical protein
MLSNPGTEVKLAQLADYAIAFLLGLAVGCCVGGVVMGLTVATREEFQRWHP